MTADTVKVTVATAQATSEGVALTMKTIEGVEVSFLLDDLATSILGLTLHGALSARKAEVTNSDQNVRLFGRDEK